MIKLNKLLLVIIILLAFTGCSTNKTTLIDNSTKGEINTDLYSIDKNLIIDKLCSDEFEGRLVGSTGNQSSEALLANEFEKINLEYLFNSSFYQPYNQLDLLNHTNEFVTVNNIIGKISGKNSNEAIVVSAHFDHIGYKNDTIIRGALDNASGVSILLSLASRLQNLSLKSMFNYDIIFCAFNGEEVGLTGSTTFLDSIDSMYTNVFNINIDCVGAVNGGDILFANSYERAGNEVSSKYDKAFLDMLKEEFTNNNFAISNSDIHVKSDDYSFQKKGFTAITITEENIWDIIHKENDIPEIIDYSKLDLIEDSIYNFIVNYL